MAKCDIAILLRMANIIIRLSFDNIITVSKRKIPKRPILQGFRDFFCHFRLKKKDKLNICTIIVAGEHYD